MKSFYYLLIVASIVILAVSCSKDEEMVEERYDVSASVSFTNTETWPVDYTIVFGAFGTDTLRPLSSVVLDKTIDSEELDVQLTQISSQAKEVRVYLGKGNNNLLSTFYKQPINVTESIEMEISSIDMLSENRVQDQVFNQCIACHGGSSGLPAGDLVLTPGNSFNALINKSATTANRTLVASGSIEDSYLVNVLKQNNISFIHSASNTLKTEDIQLIEAWINSL